MRELYELFEKYLEGDLSETEIADMERRLSEDAEFSARFQQYRAIRENLRGQIRQEEARESLASTLQGLGGEFFPREDPAKAVFRRYWLAAALTAAACLALFLLPLKTDLYSSYRQFPPAGFTTKGENGTALLQEAGKAFNQKKYEKALPFLDKYLSLQPGALEPLFFKGLCLMETGNTAEARGILFTIATGDSAFAPDAQWFLALAYLREKDYAGCKEIIKAIPPDGPYHQKALKLMKALQKK